MGNREELDSVTKQRDLLRDEVKKLAAENAHLRNMSETVGLNLVGKYRGAEALRTSLMLAACALAEAAVRKADARVAFDRGEGGSSYSRMLKSGLPYVRADQWYRKVRDEVKVSMEQGKE